jgi:hypothetical protein
VELLCFKDCTVVAITSYLLRTLPSALAQRFWLSRPSPALARLLQKRLAALGDSAKCDNIDETDLFLEFVV